MPRIIKLSLFIFFGSMAFFVVMTAGMVLVLPKHASLVNQYGCFNSNNVSDTFGLIPINSTPLAFVIAACAVLAAVLLAAGISGRRVYQERRIGLA